jgi:hypothetical protein
MYLHISVCNGNPEGGHCSRTKFLSSTMEKQYTKPHAKTNMLFKFMEVSIKYAERVENYFLGYTRNIFTGFFVMFIF